jgi:hypothetical protein
MLRFLVAAMAAPGIDLVVGVRSVLPRRAGKML